MVEHGEYNSLIGFQILDLRKIGSLSEKILDLYDQIVGGKKVDNPFIKDYDMRLKRLKEEFGFKHVFVKTEAAPDRIIEILDSLIYGLIKICNLLIGEEVSSRVNFGFNGNLTLYVGIDKQGLSNGTIAYYRPSEKRIVIKERIEDSEEVACIAHEWAHAYDHYKAYSNDIGDDILTKIRQYDRNLLKRDDRWLGEIMDLIDQSVYKSNLQKIKASSKWIAYASTPWELLSHAIEGYVYRKLNDFKPILPIDKANIYPPILDREIIDYLDNNKMF